MFCYFNLNFVAELMCHAKDKKAILFTSPFSHFVSHSRVSSAIFLLLLLFEEWTIDLNPLRCTFYLLIFICIGYNNPIKHSEVKLNALISSSLLLHFILDLLSEITAIALNICYSSEEKAKLYLKAGNSESDLLLICNLFAFLSLY